MFKKGVNNAMIMMEGQKHACKRANFRFNFSFVQLR